MNRRLPKLIAVTVIAALSIISVKAESPVIPSNQTAAIDHSAVINPADYSADSDGIIRIPAGSAEYIASEDGTLISIADLIQFDTEEEAEMFRKSLIPEIVISSDCRKNNLRVTHGNQQVASASMNGLCLISLYVSYTTSGNNHTGYITSHHAYTTFTGYTLSVGWNQTSAYSEVASSGKDIYAEATGEFITYLLVDGLIELSRQALYLHGYCLAVK